MLIFLEMDSYCNIYESFVASEMTSSTAAPLENSLFNEGHSRIDCTSNTWYLYCIITGCWLLQTVAAYFPASSSSEVYGPFTIQL